MLKSYTLKDLCLVAQVVLEDWFKQCRLIVATMSLHCLNPRPSAQERHVTLPLALSPILYLLSLIHCQLIFISINVLSGHLLKLVCLMLPLYDLISCLYF